MALKSVLHCQKKAATFILIAFASMNASAASIRYGISCDEVFASSRQVQARAVHLGRQIFASLARQLRAQELRQENNEQKFDAVEIEALDGFNAKVGLPPSKTKILSVDLDTVLDDEVQSLHYGLRGGKALAKKENPRSDLLVRLTTLISDFDDIQSQINNDSIDKKRKSLASVFVGPAEIANFLELYKKQVRSIRNLDAKLGASAGLTTEDLLNIDSLRERFPIAAELVAEITLIWTAGSLFAPSFDSGINNFLRPYIGFDIPYVSQGVSTLYAIGKAIKEKLDTTPPVLKNSGSPETKFNNPFVRYLRGLNNVAQGRWHLKDREFWYLATQYTRPPEKGEEVDDEDSHQLDLVLFQDDVTKVPTLVVFRR